MFGLTNAMNLIDGLDGLAAGIAAVGGAGLAVAAVTLGLAQPALIAAAVAGASLGFLRRNAPPASIIMGDTGSMFLGFALAGVGAAIFWSAPMARTLLGLLLISWVPALDASYAVVRRWARGESIFRGDLGHIHHRLLASGFSTRGAALSLCGLALLGSMAGVATILRSNALLWTTTLVMATLPLAWILRPQSAARRSEALAQSPRKGAVTQDRAA
jgi:UDP-GlcNAc:undecaprenyl-phosphate GlcNAc-1-phosphate transferase